MKNIRLLTLATFLGLGLLVPNETYARKYHVSLNDGTHQVITAKNKVQALLKFTQCCKQEPANQGSNEAVEADGKQLSKQDTKCSAVLSKRKKGGLIAFMSNGEVHLIK